MVLDSELDSAAEIFSIVQRARILRRHGTSYDRALRQRDVWDGRWIDALTAAWKQHLQPRDWDALVDAGRRAWGSAPVESQQVLVGKSFEPRLVQAVGAAVRAVIGSILDFVTGAMAIYMSLATDESADAGQHTLDQLGLNQTWRWTSVRDVVRDMFAVRGSKIIQDAYGTHINRLRDIVINATDPAHPKTQGEIRKQIQDEWNQLTRSQVERIARTEVASVWDTASVNAMVANEVAWFDISVAKGPSIPTHDTGHKPYPVCKRCLSAAANGPYPLPELPRVPIHPNCRCVTLPALSRDWLPPAEPWSGNEPPLTTVSAPLP